MDAKSIDGSSAFVNIDTVFLRNELRDAARECADRGLYHAAKWAAEMLNSIVVDDDDDDGGGGESESERLTTASQYTCADGATSHERDRCLLAKSYMDCREYERAAYCLRDCSGPLAVFIRLYADYMAGERNRLENAQQLLGPQDGPFTYNRNLERISQELGRLVKPDTVEPFLLYLKGIVEHRMGNVDQAISLLSRSVNVFPYNHNAWNELASCISDEATLERVATQLAENFMVKYFLVSINTELLESPTVQRDALDDLEKIFPNSISLKGQRALMHYHGREFEDAEVLFDQIIAEDPYRLEDLDVYSNILYVMEKSSKLAYLAQIASAVSKYRTETCSIVGNYYSLKTEHEKAIEYFRRALYLDRSNTAVWTLLGHEYLELKNTHAAIEAYRRALDLNRTDFRAWYGLGQTYEMLDMHYYALYYYQRATVYKPTDWRMWQGLGGCYERLQRLPEAIKAYKRALVGSATDPSVLINLANLYENSNHIDLAAKFYRQCILEDEEQVTTSSSKAALWLARHELELGNNAMAGTYIDRGLKGSYELEEFRSMKKSLQNILTG